MATAVPTRALVAAALAALLGCVEPVPIDGALCRTSGECGSTAEWGCLGSTCARLTRGGPPACVTPDDCAGQSVRRLCWHPPGQSLGVCVECLSGGDCPEPKPWCSGTSCFECIDTDQCIGEGRICVDGSCTKCSKTDPRFACPAFTVCGAQNFCVESP